MGNLSLSAPVVKAMFDTE